MDNYNKRAKWEAVESCNRIEIYIYLDGVYVGTINQVDFPFHNFGLLMRDANKENKENNELPTRSIDTNRP